MISRGLTTTVKSFALGFLHPWPLYKPLRPAAGNAGPDPKGKPEAAALPRAPDPCVPDFTGESWRVWTFGDRGAVLGRGRPASWTRWRQRRAASRGVAGGRVPLGLNPSGDQAAEEGPRDRCPGSWAGKRRPRRLGVGWAGGARVNVRPAPAALTQFHQKLGGGDGRSPEHPAPGRKRRPEPRRKPGPEPLQPQPHPTYLRR